MGVPQAGTGRRELPVGTLTFFRSDLEGSMALTRSLGARYDELNVAHLDIIRAAIERHRGALVRTEGDAAFAAFAEAPAAARAAIEAQRALTVANWNEDGAFRVRIGLHTGAARHAGDDYGGFEVGRAARIASLGWGGQTILSDPARALIAEDADDDWTIRDLGRHRLKGVIEPERIYQLDATGLDTEFPALRSGATATEHLPERAASLVGRLSELDELSDLLAETRLLTLTGPGGAGKTTLAIELARQHAADHADGAWFVDLQDVRDVASVSSEVAHGLGLLDGSAGPAAERLLPYVAERELLIVIDNFEQLLPASRMLAEMLDTSPRSRLIVTSRAPLRLRGEQEYPLGPLATDGRDGEPSEAARLFVDRARRVRPGLALEAELGIVHEICRAVDGLPLAIELAAARVSSLPLRLIRDRLIERLPLPGQGPHDLPDRQRTIESTIAWSHDLLAPPLQRLFARLGVIHESFELEQVGRVCGPADELGVDPLDGLVALVDHALVFRVDDALGGFRYGMLDSIRAFAESALEASGESESMWARHLAAYGALVEREWPILDIDEAVALTVRVEADDANVRAAVATAIETGALEVAMRMVGLMWRPWSAIGRLEDGRRLIDRVLAMPGAEADRIERVMALDAAGGAAYWAGDLTTATARYEEQLAIGERLEKPLAVGMASINVNFCRVFRGDAEGAERALGTARRIAEEHDLRSALAWVDIMQMVPLVLAAYPDPEGHRGELEATIDRFEATGDPRYLAPTQSLHAMLGLADGDLVGAARSIAAAVRANLAQREVADAALYLVPIGATMGASGHPEVAATVQGATAAAFERLGIAPPMDVEAAGWEDPTPVLIEALGREGYALAFERGRRMSLLEATDYIDATADRLVEAGGGPA